MKKRINGRTKGHTFERSIASFMRSFFPTARRGLQYQDGFSCPDVVGTPFHIECKRGRKVNIRAAFAQARTDRERMGTKFPILVVSKEDHEPVIVSMELEDFKPLLSLLSGGYDNYEYYRRMKQGEEE